MDVAASFMPAAAHVSGDFYLVAEGPHDSSVLVVGDVVGKGLAAARRAAFVRTVFATTAPYSDDPARLLGWANVALLEHATDDREFVTVACAVFSPRERLVRWAYAGHPAMLWLDSGDELQGGRTMPLALSAERGIDDGNGWFHAKDGRAALYRRRNRGPPKRRAIRPDSPEEHVRALEGQRASRIVAALTEGVEQFANRRRTTCASSPHESTRNITSYTRVGARQPPHRRQRHDSPLDSIP
jgi:hypothetical protein